MARPRRIEADQALQAAMALFWRNGYAQTGTRQIEEETGITRFLLQREYGGKKSLFLQSLDHYLDVFEEIGAPPSKPESPEALIGWFEGAPPEPAMREMANNGCLLLASMSEGEARDTDLAPRCERFFDLLRTRFHAALAHLVSIGAIRGDLDIAGGTEMMVALAIAKNTYVRAARDIEAAAPVGRAARALIAQWGT